jgi:molybdenum cofactor synthesis domain-containing protein
MRPIAEAQAEVLDAVSRLPVKALSLREAGGLVLAAAIDASHDLPPFPNSAMDGYAVRAEDVAATPAELRVLEDVPAGSVPSVTVEPGTAIKIMTGAPMPAGADSVVKVEDTEPAGDRVVRILAPVSLGTAVRAAGGDIRAGSRVVDAGVRLGAAHLGVLAAVGEAWPKVYRRPLVGIMSTGDEVVPPETSDLGPGKIRDTNRSLLRRLLEELGATVIDFGIVPDDAGALRSVLGHASHECDVVVTSGGVSMGEYDLVKIVLSELGTVDFWRVAMKPAKPFAFGALDETPFFGLPGNPVSVVVAFEQFLRPALLHMMGAERLFRPRIMGVTGEDLHTDPEKTVFLRVAVDYTAPGGWQVRMSGGQDSNVLSALAAADGFAVVPVGVADVPARSPVELEMFRWPETRTRAEALDGR